MWDTGRGSSTTRQQHRAALFAAPDALDAVRFAEQPVSTHHTASYFLSLFANQPFFNQKFAGNLFRLALVAIHLKV
jgi:hypothetical protein